MVKGELIAQVAEELNLTRKEATMIVNTVFSSIIESLSKSQKVELRGFGSFRIKQRRARQGRNPRTGDPVKVPSKKIPFFKPGKDLKVVG
ncbi:MAG: integration host factor subunit beta [Candidatus Schekmanbacteria bacterium]|nr:integration host factor subunit beta [Candidatus Schekmanbacteria bacterium]